MKNLGIVRLLFFGWWSLVALLPLGHVTGLRNTWTVLIVVGTLIWLRRDAWRDLPARFALLALLLWCGASIAWSTTPAISFGKWQTDLLLPLAAYAAAFGFVRRTGAIAAWIGGAVTGIGLLAILSLPAWFPAGWSTSLINQLLLEPFANELAPLPIWYPGVGDASMATSMVAALLVCAPRCLPRIPRSAWVLSWVLLAFVVVVSNNRNAAVAIPLVVLCAVVIDRRRARDTPSRSNRPRVVLIALALVVAAAGLVAMLESGARERLRVIGEPVGDGQSALLVLTERDTRPMIWAYYTKLAIRSPIVGVGFGRTVPGIHYHTQDDRDLARVEFNAYIHAHNLFLNWWLQTGVVGVALLVWVLASVTIEARRIARDGSIPLARTALVSLYALIALMVIRDATDDLLVFGMATLFWTLLGALGGVLRRTADATGRRVP